MQSFIHNMNVHFKRLQTDKYSDELNDPLSCSNLSLQKITQKSFIKFNILKASIFKKIENKGIYKISDIIWLKNLDFKFPQISEELNCIDHLFTCTSFRYYEWNKVGNILGSAYNPDLKGNKLFFCELEDTGNEIHNYFGCKLYYPLKKGIIIAYGYLLPQPLDPWIKCSVFKIKYVEKFQALVEKKFNQTTATNILNYTSLKEIILLSTDEFLKKFEPIFKLLS